ncbi:class I SAM-dependent methyltransferase, partial [Frankia sp. Cpl3]|nr:class I SAM-dependent methyltransferase [Frankia sp. Cpl3]
MDWINPTSPEKLVKAAQILGLQPGQRVIDYGCGFGSLLALWGKQFGITGTGIELRSYACERAKERLQKSGLLPSVQIRCENAAV